MAPPSPGRRGYIEVPPQARLTEFAVAEFDPDTLQRAERVVADVLARFPTLLNDEISKLLAAWQAAPKSLTRETVAPAFKIAHELAGCGETFGYPLVTIFARSLCRLLSMGDLGREQMAAVVEAHIATLRVIVRDQMQGSGGEVGLQLAASLDQAISKFNLGAATEVSGRLREEVAALHAKK